MAEKKVPAKRQKKEKDMRKNNNPRGTPLLRPEMLQGEAGDMTKLLNLNIELGNMDEVDINDGEAVKKRINEYFALYAKYDLKPTVAGMGLALGVNRQRLWEIANDVKRYDTGKYANLPTLTRVSIKKAYSILENLWENYFNSGKINPVAGIFLGKNQFGYQDKQEYVVTPNVNDSSDFDPTQIKQRYISDSNPIDSDPSDSSDS